MALECNKWAGLYLMSLFHTNELGYSYLLHIPPINDTKNVQISRAGQKNNERLSGALRGFRVATVTAQAPRQHVSVNVPAWWRCTRRCTMSISWITKWYSKIHQPEVLPWRWWLPGCRTLNPTFDPLKNCQHYKSHKVELLNVWCCKTLAFISSFWKTIINWFIFLFSPLQFCLLTPQITTILEALKHKSL